MLLMESETRTNALLKMHDTFPHLKELELDRLLRTEPKLFEAAVYFAQKAVYVAGNRNATLNVMEDHLWSILGTLWDQHQLVLRKDADRARSDFHSMLPAKASPEMFEGEPRLKSRLTVIETIMTTPVIVSGDRRYDISLQVEDPFIPIKNVKDEEQSNSEVFLTSSIPATARLGISSSPSCLDIYSFTSASFETVPESNTDYLSKIEGLELEIIKLRSELRKERVDTASTEISSLYQQKNVVSRALIPESFEPIVIRENELRINSLLSEVIERDEVIHNLSDELERLRGGNRRSSIRRPSIDIIDEGNPRRYSIDSSTNMSAVFADRIKEIEVLRKKNSDLEIEKINAENERDNLQSRLDLITQEMSLQVVKRSVFSGLSSRTAFAGTQDESISARIPSSVRGESFDSPCQTTDVLTTLSCTVARVVNITPLFDGDLLARLQEEHESAEAAMRETEKTKMSLGQLEKQLAMLKLQLKRYGVKEAHIYTAMSRSGLTGLMRANKAGVFERLYQDAFDRVMRMQRIRDQIRAIESQQFQTRVSAETNSGRDKLFQLFPQEPREFSHTSESHTERHFYGGGWAFASLQTHLYHAKNINERSSTTQVLPVNECLITTHLDPSAVKRKLLL